MDKIFEAQIGYNNDFIKDNRTGQYMDSFTTEDLLQYGLWFIFQMDGFAIGKY